jgi:hypothetical protein
MTVQAIDSVFSSTAAPPTDPIQYRAWLQMLDVGAFLTDSTKSDISVLDPLSDAATGQPFYLFSF